MRRQAVCIQFGSIELDGQFDDAQIINIGFSDLFGRKRSRFLSRRVRF